MFKKPFEMGYNMQIDRLMGILTVMLQKGRVTAPSLAEKFEVSRRTIMRDIDTLCRAGIPIVTHRQIEPYYMVFKWSSWYVFGFCLQRNCWRLFKLSRMHNLTLPGTVFEPRPVPLENDLIKPDYSNAVTYKLLFDLSLRQELIGSYGKTGFAETAGGLYIETTFANHSFALYILRGYVSRVKVLEPQSTADELAQDAKKIYEIYNQT